MKKLNALISKAYKAKSRKTSVKISHFARLFVVFEFSDSEIPSFSVRYIDSSVGQDFEVYSKFCANEFLKGLR